MLIGWRFLQARKKLTTHERLYGNNKWSLKPDHYLELIQQRPLAFNSARPIQQWRKNWPQSLHLLLERFCRSQGETNGIKDFITVLMFYRDYKAGEIEAAVELALENSISTSDGVHHVLAYTGGRRHDYRPLDRHGRRCHLRIYRFMRSWEVSNESRGIDGAEGRISRR